LRGSSGDIILLILEGNIFEKKAREECGRMTAIMTYGVVTRLAAD